LEKDQEIYKQTFPKELIAEKSANHKNWYWPGQVIFLLIFQNSAVFLFSMFLPVVH